MTKWTTLIAALKQRNYVEALNELAVIQNYDDLQDALQVMPFKSLNQDLPASLVLLENVYAKFMLLTNDKEEGRLIIRHVFKADSLLKNFIRLEVESVLVGGLDGDLECKDLIGHITQVTWSMDKHLVDELMDYSSRLKTAIKHYHGRKALMMECGFEVDDVKSNLQSCLAKYHSFIRHLDSLTKMGTRKHSEGKGYTVVYKEGYDSSRKSSTARHNGGRLTRSKSLVEDVASHRKSVEQVRKRMMFNQVVLDVIEPCRKDIEEGPRLLQNLRELVENDNKFLEVVSELSSIFARPSFSHIKLEKILGQFAASYERLLLVVTSEKESHLPDQKSVEIKSCGEKNISVQNDKDTDTGLVNHGLKINVTASSPFHRRYDARRAVRTHSCRETRSGIKQRKSSTTVQCTPFCI